MVLITATDDFKFEWPRPEDAESVWLWDEMHVPRPLPPMAALITERIMTRIMGGRRLVINGYLYNAFGGPATAGGPRSEAGGPNPSGATYSDPWEAWTRDLLPRMKEVVADLRSRDYESMTAARLARSLDQLVTQAGDAFLLTFAADLNVGAHTNKLIDFCEQRFGPEGAVRAMTMLQGYENESAATGAGLSRLADLAAQLPEVGAALTRGRFDRLEALPSGATFVRELRAYLDEYGWRATTWGEIHLPTWAEDPAVPLKLIARYLSDPERAPAASLRRAVAQREATVAETEALLRPDEIEHFRALLRAARRHVPISEDRAMWQLMCTGVLRIPLLALGRKLAHAGRLTVPDDVFFLTFEEAADLAEGKPLVGIQALIDQRQADFERWRRLIPPKSLGAPPPPVLYSMTRRFFGYGVEQLRGSGIVSGIAASRGVVQATARVVRDLADADRLGAGEVLVCPSTAPPWTPLFAIAAAVVTDSGGVLSHSAIAAREYGIPAVVGTGVGTQRIPDGALVTVDGGQGIVRIEGQA
jgi:phosphohistidine swiveling domain-containing protein